MYDADANPTNLQKCTEDGCWHPFYARGLCQRHYLRWYRGVPIAPKRQRLPESFKVFRG